MIALTPTATLRPLVLPARADAADADESRPMLSIDEALGFIATAYEDAQRKDLS